MEVGNLGRGGPPVFLGNQQMAGPAKQIGLGDIDHLADVDRKLAGCIRVEPGLDDLARNLLDVFHQMAKEVFHGRHLLITL